MSVLVTDLLSVVPKLRIIFRIYRELIVLLLLFGCQTWSLSLSDEAKLRVFENIQTGTRPVRLGNGEYEKALKFMSVIQSNVIETLTPCAGI